MDPDERGWGRTGRGKGRGSNEQDILYENLKEKRRKRKGRDEHIRTGKHSTMENSALPSGKNQGAKLVKAVPSEGQRTAIE